MKTILKVKLEKAITEWLENCSEEDLISTNYDIYIHDSLPEEMTNAAEAVFDCLAKFQEWQNKNS